MDNTHIPSGPIFSQKEAREEGVGGETWAGVVFASVAVLGTEIFDVLGLGRHVSAPPLEYQPSSCHIPVVSSPTTLTLRQPPTLANEHLVPDTTTTYLPLYDVPFSMRAHMLPLISQPFLVSLQRTTTTTASALP
jgi:hypothetical protein